MFAWLLVAYQGHKWLHIKVIIVNEFFYFDSNSTYIFFSGPTNDKPALVQINAWCQTSNKPLSESAMADFIDAYVRHSASMK